MATRDAALSRMMPRYFFQTVDGGRDFDEEGVELADDDAARVEAVKLLSGIMYDRPALLLNGRAYRVEVTTPTGDLLFTVVMSASDAAPLERDR